MQRWRGLDDIPPDWGRCVVTIGVFDGIHRGHAQLIERAVDSARRHGVKSVVMTFDPHPMEVVRPGSHPLQLTTLRRRAELVERLGADVFCVIPFTHDFMKYTPDRYVHEILVERFHVVEVVVGENFTYGRKAAGDVSSLRSAGHRFGFSVDAVSLVGEDPLTYSSTYVRACVDAGDMVAATTALARPHRVEGVVVHGQRRGRSIGFPTANVESAPHTAIPADGIYAAWLTVLGPGTQIGDLAPGSPAPAAVSVGTNPTFSGVDRTVEAYVLDADVNLYGQHVAIDFEERLRPMIRFDSVEELTEQIAKDCDDARKILRGKAGVE